MKEEIKLWVEFKQWRELEQSLVKKGDTYKRYKTYIKELKAELGGCDKKIFGIKYRSFPSPYRVVTIFDRICFYQDLQEYLLSLPYEETQEGFYNWLAEVKYAKRESNNKL